MRLAWTPSGALSLASLPPSRPVAATWAAEWVPPTPRTSASRPEPGQGLSSLLLSATSPQSPAGKPQQTRAGPRHCGLNKSGVLPVGRGPRPPPAGVPGAQEAGRSLSLGFVRARRAHPALGTASEAAAAASRGPQAAGGAASRFLLLLETLRGPRARPPGRRCGPGNLDKALSLVRMSFFCT